MTGSDPGLPDPRANPRFDKTLAQHAARDPARPGEKCGAAPLAYIPRIDRGRCEGKAACVAVCPYGVFEVGRIADEDFRALSFLGRLKSRAHGRRTALTPRSDACRACGLCVVACPERAIALIERTPGA
jgi:NAD-dependent dihydropyrimidine dehydrogenase PreA subunit